MRHLVHALPDTIAEVEAQQLSHTHWANLRACLRKNRPVISDQKINFPYILGY